MWGHQRWTVVKHYDPFLNTHLPISGQQTTTPDLTAYVAYKKQTPLPDPGLGYLAD
jgi:hypothetical protein